MSVLKTGPQIRFSKWDRNATAMSPETVKHARVRFDVQVNNNGVRTGK